MYRLQYRILDSLGTFKHTKLQYASFISIQNYRNSRSFSNRNTSDRLRTFDMLLCSRQQEARRSIVVQVYSDKSYNELYRYCSQFGAIKKSFHYQNRRAHSILIEFECEKSANDALRTGVFDESVVPAVSRFLWFRAAERNATAFVGDVPPLAIIDGNAGTSPKELHALLHQQQTIDQQIHTLYENTSISDLGYRLRFIAAAQIEQCIRGLFPRAEVHPFGSSVNGFGSSGSDLDMNLVLLPEEKTDQNRHRLVFHTRQPAKSDRALVQGHLAIISDIIKHILPGILSIQMILNAKVPIVRYHQEYLNLPVDLSMNNLSPNYMSELMFLFGECDSRVRPLMVCIRHWAKSTGITSAHPGCWISNFGLTCLVIFFLQQLKEPVLPTLNHLINQSCSEDNRLLEWRNVDYLRDVNQIDFKSTNTETLQELLMGFFKFYSNFNFVDKAVSLHTTSAVNKTEQYPILIVNPIDPDLNVTKNVSKKECSNLQCGMQIAYQQLEADIVEGLTNNHGSWGILQLIGEQNPISKNTKRSAQVICNNFGNANVAKHVIQMKAHQDVQRLLSVKSMFGGVKEKNESEANDKSTKKALVNRLMMKMGDTINQDEAKKIETPNNHQNINKKNVRNRKRPNKLFGKLENKK